MELAGYLEQTRYLDPVGYLEIAWYPELDTSLITTYIYVVECQGLDSAFITIGKGSWRQDHFS